jgi:hypothetical protein
MADGRRPSTRERLLLDSAETLAPHHSLERVDRAVTTVTTAATIAGALVAGLGTLAAETADAGIGWALPAVGLVALSVACAVLSAVPIHRSVIPGDVEQVAKFFETEISRRGRLVRVAGYALAAAIMVAPMPLVAAALDDPTPTVDIDARVSDDRRVRFIARGSALDDTATLRLRVVSDGRELDFALADAGADGDATAAVALSPLPNGARVTALAGSSSPEIRRSRSVTVPGPRP